MVSTTTKRDYRQRKRSQRSANSVSQEILKIGMTPRTQQLKQLIGNTYAGGAEKSNKQKLDAVVTTGQTDEQGEYCVHSNMSELVKRRRDESDRYWLRSAEQQSNNTRTYKHPRRVLHGYRIHTH